MERDLTNILTEVLVFPYEQSIVDSLKKACSTYVEAIELGQYEDCVLHLCLDIRATEFIEFINTKTGRKFPDRVYRALAGYVVGEAMATVSDEDDKVMFPLALRNVMKAKTDDAGGIIRKCIDPSKFATVEDYWQTNINIPSLSGKKIVTSIFNKTSWAETGLDIKNTFDDIQVLAKYYCREQFKKKYSFFKPSDALDIYAFAIQVAEDISSQDWLFTVENPVEALKNMELRGPAISLNTIKTRLQESMDANDEDIDAVSVYRCYLYANDYKELGSRRISPQSFGIAIFYELLYERLKSENYE